MNSNTIYQQLEDAIKAEFGAFVIETRRAVISLKVYEDLFAATKKQSPGYFGSDNDLRFQLKLVANFLQSTNQNEFSKYAQSSHEKTMVVSNYSAHAFPSAEEYFGFRENFDGALRFLDYLLTLFESKFRADFGGKGRIEKLRKVFDQIPPTTPSSLKADEKNVTI